MCCRPVGMQKGVQLVGALGRSWGMELVVLVVGRQGLEVELGLGLELGLVPEPVLERPMIVHQVA